MSENLKRSNPDFSKYDSMSIGELEEILRADAQGPERDDSDVDEILYVMEVLAKKRRQNDIAGKTALEAYQEFQQYYLPMIEEENIESVSRRKGTIIPFRRIVAVAASLVLVFTLVTSANAVSIKDIWNAAVRWAEETFSFSTDVEVSDPHNVDTLQYLSLHDALCKEGFDSYMIPTWVPERFEIVDIIIDRNPIQESYIAIYTNNSAMLKISVISYLATEPEQVEKSENLIETHEHAGMTFYIFSNNGRNCAAWNIGAYECYVSGDISIEDIKLMINSIGEG